MARTYKRDSRGRFASGGGSSGSGGRPKARMQQRGTNRLTRDNAGRIQGIGGSGATARGGRLKTASGKQRGAVLMKAQGQGRLRGGKGMGGDTAAAKEAKVAKVAKRSRPDLSQGAFERRAKVTEKRARAAERVVSSIDRYNPSNRKLVNRANSLRSAADSYSSYARRGKTDPDFSAAYLFQRRSRSTTAPKLSRSEKAAATRRANADKRFRENVRRMEQARRR